MSFGNILSRVSGVAALVLFLSSLPLQAAVNDIRSAHGLAPLARSATLDAVAREHARYLARLGRLSHSGPQGQIGDRARAAGYDYCQVAENLARGHRSEDAVLRGWLRSPSHRRNLLHRDFAEYGMARTGGNVWVLVVGRRGC
ncbi:CAP domain-containing protein [Roseivivax marinus]|uniref:CAP domain-containing protein n=1 Tax=Roseivivax marinus TaxID=1379903 RepID=UPI00273F19FC|nr:CAP domain-containing protein [Roseivivax marinus]